MAERILKDSSKSPETPFPPFCDCGKKTFDTRLSTHKVQQALSNCKCGEDKGGFEWSWDKEVNCPTQSDIIFDEHEVHFHPTYSQGTAVARGEKPLEYGKIHYWEIKMQSFCTGTDLMVGLGTDKVDIHSQAHSFMSFLGHNDQSWGFSYRGLAQHDGRFKYYGRIFSRGCIVGCYLDLKKGFLEFFINRKSMGKAYTNIPLNDKSVKLYPMVCSTSAKTVVKLINSTSVDPTLQFLCMKVISKRPQLLQQMQSIPGLSRLLPDLWFLQSKEQYVYTDFEQNNLLLEDEAVIGSKKKKFIEETDSSSDSDGDIYKNIHRIKHFKSQPASSSSSSNDSSSEHEETMDYLFFCNHF